MLNDAAAKKSAANFLATRVVAVRAELSATEKNPATWARTAAKTLRRDLLDLECRLAEVVS